MHNILNNLALDKSFFSECPKVWAGCEACPKYSSSTTYRDEHECRPGGSPADAIEVGELIRKRREAIQMSVAQLAKRIGVSRNTITNYESGRTEPTASHLIAIGKALGSSIADLLGIGAVAHSPRFAFRSHSALRKDPDILATARNFLRAYAEIEEITGARCA